MKTRRLAALMALVFLGALANAAPKAAAPARPDVRRLNDSKQGLRAQALASAKVLEILDKGTPLLVLETGASRVTVDGRSGNWLKVRSALDQEGYLHSSYLDKASAAWFLASDFPSPELYSDYLHLALRRGERVKATGDYESVEAGDLGWYVSWSEEEPYFQVVWDRDLDATPLDSAIDPELPRILEDRIYFVYADILAAAGTAATADFPALALDWAESRMEEFDVGAVITLGAHLLTDPSDEESLNWNEEMAQYIGQTATITEVGEYDSWDRPCVRVDIDGGDWQWRIENMRLGDTSEGGDYSEGDEYYSDSGLAVFGEETYGRIAVGSIVLLGRHDAVNEETNWNEAMDQYVGTKVKVTELDGSDDSGSLGVRVDGNSYFWRVRNMTLVGHGEAGSYGFAVGDRVILGSHREVSGDSNWSEDMEEYVGQEATITELLGYEDGDAHCYLVAVDIDGGEWVWRVENMTPAP